MPDHDAGPPPTPGQQACIRRLARQRGVSFTPPRTKAEASRLIDQLRRRTTDGPADQHRRLKAVRTDELEGHGPNATSGRDGVVNATDAPVELARYRISSGERRLIGQRVLGVVRLVDAPTGTHGRRYVVERELRSKAELDALVCDYVAQAVRFDEIPIRHSPVDSEIAG